MRIQICFGIFIMVLLKFHKHKNINLKSNLISRKQITLKMIKYNISTSLIKLFCNYLIKQFLFLKFIFSF